MAQGVELQCALDTGMRLFSTDTGPDTLDKPVMQYSYV